MKARRHLYRYSRLRTTLTKRIPTEIGHYMLYIGNKPLVNKLVLINKLNGFHHTLLFNDHINVVDLHKTQDGVSDVDKYQSLLKLPYAAAKRLLVAIRVAVKSAFQKHLTLYAMAEFENLDIVLIPLEHENLTTSLINTSKKNRIRAAKDLHPQTIESWFKYPNNLQPSDGNTFVAFDNRYYDDEPIGLCIRKPETGSVAFIDFEAMNEVFKKFDDFGGKELFKSLTKEVRN